MFLDEAQITVHGGDGGDGLVSWRREKFISRGGPWGGDGGNGGNVIFAADGNTDTLTKFAQEKVFHAKEGRGGGKARKHGKTGDDLILKVSPGTVITDLETNEVLADLTHDGSTVQIARGGRGGYGNAHFATSIRQAPDFAEKGETGEVKKIKLELKLVADVGIIGYPSTGKSTLISTISASKPKIADYPFTTLVPNLGVVTVYDRSFIVCDVPGLIEGASEGKGLGDTFLRHIERCGVLLHLLDINREDIMQDYRAIRKELEKHSPALAQKRELVILNKIDLVQHDASIFIEELKKNDIDVFASISAVTKHGTDEMLTKLLPIALEERARRENEKSEKEVIPTIRPQMENNRADAFTIEEEPKGTFHVHGKRIEQIAKMTDWSSSSGTQRFRDIAQRTGLQKSLEQLGAKRMGSKVFVGSVDVSGEW